MNRWIRSLLLATAAVSTLPYVGSALPASGLESGDLQLDSRHPFAGFDFDLGSNIYTRDDVKKVDLRIMPLGASIMSGQGSDTHDGLRMYLRQALVFNGWNVNMVGRLHEFGEMKDKDHEAVPGDVITQVHDRLKKAIGYKPNVVIINAGTNDAIQAKDVPNAGQRMEDLLNDIWKDDTTDACVILSTLIDTSDDTGKVNRLSINGQYRRLVKDLSADHCIYLADMAPEGDNSDWIQLPQDYTEGEKTHVHPNNEGHKKMAYVFYQAIMQAANDGKIQAAKGDFEVSTNCDKEYGDGVSAGGKTQRGVGKHDGTYQHEAEDGVVVYTLESDYDRDQWRFARVFDRDYDDILGWYEKDEKTHMFGLWKNSADGNGVFEKIDDLNPGMYCKPRGLHWIDMNADGLDDIVCIYPDGSLYQATNKGDGDRDAGKAPGFTFEGKIKDPEGQKQDRVRLGDIDGDGRGDYGVIQDNGDVHWWRNGWVHDKPLYWQALGSQTPDMDFDPPKDEILFEDINGDGRDDYVYMNEMGRTEIWTNARSCKKGKEGDGLHVAWRKAIHKGGKVGGPGDHSDWTHYGMQGLKEDNEDTPGDRVFFARIFGTPSAFGNLGRQDYVFLERKKKDDKHEFLVHVWKSKGQGGTKLLADGDKYCNMMGHASGAQDYVWTLSTGQMTLYANRGKESVSDSDADGFWEPSDIIWTPPRDMDRRDLHLADWDNDGVCDIIYVNPDGGGVEVFINKYLDEQKWNFEQLDNPAPGVECLHDRGIGIHDLSVRFADLTGNGRADYLCIEKDGRVSGYVHKDDDSWEHIDQIKYSEGKDRANLRWADVNGDGRDDMIYIDKFNGDGYIWYNEDRDEPSETSGSSFRWREVGGASYQGSQAGTCMYYPDLDGNGRADMHGILGTWTNEARTWFNMGCGLTDSTDDNTDVEDPKLPVMPDSGTPGTGLGQYGYFDPDEYFRNVDCGKDQYKDNWRCKTCDDPMTNERGVPGWDLWPEFKVGEAWDACLEFWEAGITAGAEQKDFSGNISAVFHGPDNMKCETLTQGDENNCHQNLKCDDGDLTIPAGYLILDSFSGIYDNHKQMFDAITGAVINEDSGNLAEDFGKVPKKGYTMTESILIDIGTTAYGLIMGSSWNRYIVPKINKGNSNNIGGDVKDTTNDLVKNSATITKDVLNSKPVHNQLEQANEVHAQMLAIANAWRTSISDTNTWLFSGAADSNQVLGNMILNGSFIGNDYVVNTFEFTQLASSAFNSLLIPEAWKSSPDVIKPFIAETSVGCNEDPGWNADATFNTAEHHYIKDEALEKGWKCIDDKPYWLLMGRDSGKSCNDQRGFTDCRDFDRVQGYDVLESNVYNVTVENVIRGNSNGDTDVDATNVDTLQKFIDKGIEASGYWKIPVCSMDEVVENYSKWFTGSVNPDDNENFPCNE